MVEQKPTVTERSDRAVSPVIGVILMVAITVILAAVIGTFVLDIGQSAGQAAPQASLSVSANAGTDNLSVSHNGGDGLSSETTRVRAEYNGSTVTFDETSDAFIFSVGDEATVNLTSSNEGVDWSDESGYEYSREDHGGNGFDTGDRITLTLIDTESQRVIYETTITA